MFVNIPLVKASHMCEPRVREVGQTAQSVPNYMANYMTSTGVIDTINLPKDLNWEDFLAHSACDLFL